MKKLILILIISIFVLIISLKQNYAQTPYNDPNWRLMFVDEFDSIYVDHAKWVSGFPWNQDSIWIACEYDTIEDFYSAFYMRNFENCTIDTTGSGKISLQAKYHDNPFIGEVWIGWEPDTDIFGDTIGFHPIEADAEFNFSRQVLVSRDSLKYGWLEIKSKLPQPVSPDRSYGVACPFWLFAGGYQGQDSIEWSEIDIYEICGENNGHTNYHTCNFHYTDNNITYEDYQNTHLDTVIDFTNYHVFSAEWSKEKVDIYVDDTIIRSVDQYADKLVAMPLIINVCMPAMAFCQDSCDTANLVLPYNYEVDYVKIWQLNMDCDSIVNICSFDADSFDYSVYKEINIGGSGCNPTVYNGDTVVFRATDAIALNAGFKVELGGSLLILPTECQDNDYREHRNTKNITAIPPPDAWLEKMNYK